MSWEKSESESVPVNAGASIGAVALILGAALGAVAALLLAPKSGKDLRDEVANKATDWKSHAADAITQGREKVISAVETAKK
jgi:gas vesicle protein